MVIVSIPVVLLYIFAQKYVVSGMTAGAVKRIERMTMKERYCGKWESVKKHRIPQWYEDCKFGIFIHWGLYSVPAFAPRSWELGEVEVNEEWFTNNPYARVVL